MTAVTFTGGIHPKYNKDRTSASEIAVLPTPDEVVIPLSQHIGAPAKAVVEKGSAVAVGQLIAEPGGFVSTPIHSSVSGKVKAVEPRLGGMGVPVQSVVIENDGEYKEVDFAPLDDWKNADGRAITGKVNDAGIVGMGGATFPTHVKLSPPPNKPIDTVILNGAECEPYLTADHRVMVESPGEVVKGLELILKVLGATTGIIGIEENKPDAIKAMTEATEEGDVKVVPLEIKYPQGGEKQLIQAVLGREVPSGGLPMDVGVVVQNVGTAQAVFQAVAKGKPLFERVVTVTGSAVEKPGNFMVRIGTPVSAVLDHCGVELEKTGKLVLGGPMMGFSQFSAEPPVIKGTSGILAFKDSDVTVQEPQACIKCGRCVGACPMNLVPSEIAAFTDFQMYDEAEGADVLDCMECGSCAHECPSRIPLVQKIRLAKSEVLAARKKKA